MDSFWENRKKSKNGCFLAIFGLILAMFLTSRPYDFDAFAHAGAPLGEEWLCKISWKSYGQFLRNLKFSWKGREKKKHRRNCHCATAPSRRPLWESSRVMGSTKVRPSTPIAWGTSKYFRKKNSILSQKIHNFSDFSSPFSQRPMIIG